MTLPNPREMKILRALRLGSVEDFSQWNGAGKITEAALVSKGWIEPAHCEIYGTDGYRITAAGKEALQAAE